MLTMNIDLWFSFLVISLFGFDIRAIVASKNVLVSVPFYSILQKIMSRIVTISSLKS